MSLDSTTMVVTKVWVKEDGTRLEVPDMSEDHLLDAASYLEDQMAACAAEMHEADQPGPGSGAYTVAERKNLRLRLGFLRGTRHRLIDEINRRLEAGEMEL